MILPRTRLLVYYAAVVLPAGVLAALAPSSAAWIGAAAAALLVVPVCDAVLSGRSVEGLNAELPPLLRLTRGVRGGVDVRLTHPPGPPGRRLLVGLAAAPETPLAEECRRLTLPADAERSTAEFSILPAVRGSFPLGPVYLGALSPLGFWLRRKTVASPSQARVYPNLLGERRRLAAMFLHRGGVGLHAQRQIGQGRQFEKLREYIPGDSYDQIHWKATARRAKPITKVYQIERTQEVYVVLDASRLSGRPSVAGGEAPADGPPPTHLERLLTGALVLAGAAQRQGDLFGVMTFSDRVEAFVRARTGPGHYRACREALYALQPRLVSPDFSEVFAFQRVRLRRRALLVFLTALDEPILAESFLRHVGLIARQHLVVVNMIRPSGVAPVFSPAPGAGGDDVYAALAGHLQWQRLRELGKDLSHRGVRLNLVEDEKLCPELVSQYLAVKRRQLL